MRMEEFHILSCQWLHSVEKIRRRESSGQKHLNFTQLFADETVGLVSSNIFKFSPVSKKNPTAF